MRDWLLGIEPPSRSDVGKFMEMTAANGYDKDLSGRSIYRGIYVTAATNETKASMVEKLLIKGGYIGLKETRRIESWTTDVKVAESFTFSAFSAAGARARHLGMVLRQRPVKKNTLVLNMASDRFWKDLEEHLAGNPSGRRGLDAFQQEKEVAVKPQCGKTCGMKNMASVFVDESNEDKREFHRVLRAVSRLNGVSVTKRKIKHEPRLKRFKIELRGS